MKILLVLLILSVQTFAQILGKDLKSFSTEINKSLPEIYDHATKLMTTTVDNNNFYYHFILRATKVEYAQALPKVHTQILKTICSQKRENSILTGYKANIIYRYENEKGQSLGEFMVQPSHCLKSSH